MYLVLSKSVCQTDCNLLTTKRGGNQVKSSVAMCGRYTELHAVLSLFGAWKLFEIFGEFLLQLLFEALAELDVTVLRSRFKDR
jgi:hypothetical protein